MKYLGFGLGLRPVHYNQILSTNPRIDWLEALTENYLGRHQSGAGKPLKTLLEIREKFPLVLHGVSLSIGSSDPLRVDYLKRLKNLIDLVQPEWVSDHLCWTSVGGHNSHDLLPLPYTEAVLKHLTTRIRMIEDIIERPLVLENVSSYAEFRASEFSEWEFIRELCERTDIQLLLDINNIYVSAINHGFSPESYINAIPRNRVIQFHLAGHTNKGHYLIDTHDHPVTDPVWDLYRLATRRFGKISTMIEWDARIPSLDRLICELDRARELSKGTLRAA